MSAIEQMPQMVTVMKDIAHLTQELAQPEASVVEERAKRIVQNMARMAESMAELLMAIADGDKQYRMVSIVMDLNNPLKALRAYSDLLSSVPEWFNGTAHLKKLKQIDALTNKLLDWYSALYDEYSAQRSNNSPDFQ
jgi:hypothetical protein